MPSASPSRRARLGLDHQLQQVASAASIDDFARGCQGFFREVLPYHSLCISFSRLEYVCPWLIRDTLPERCDLSYIHDRYHALNPSRPFLRKNVGVGQSVFEEQMALMPPEARESYTRRFRKNEGWDKYAEIHFWDAGTLQANICVRRGPAQRDFRPGDLRLLRELREALHPAVAQLHRHHRERMTADSLNRVLRRLPIPLMVLDWGLEPLSATTEAHAACLEWIHGPAARAFKPGRTLPVPPEVAAVAAEEKEHFAGNGFRTAARNSRNARLRTVECARAPHLTAQIELLESSSDLVALPNFLVRFQAAAAPAGAPPTAAKGAPPRSFSALAALSPSEREVARLLGQGLGNREIAARLSRSVPTVKMHVHAILRKLGAPNRTHAALLLGR